MAAGPIAERNQGNHILSINRFRDLLIRIPFISFTTPNKLEKSNNSLLIYEF